MKPRNIEVLWLEKPFDFATDSLFCEGNNWNNIEAVLRKTLRLGRSTLYEKATKTDVM